MRPKKKIELSDLTPDIVSRFWDRVEKLATECGCWLWTAGGVPRGYGIFNPQKRLTGYAHRVSALLAGIIIPSGMQIMHSCDSPWCVNPAHLSVGTNAQNAADMAKKRRSTWGTRNPQAKLSENQVREIRWLYSQGKNRTQIAKIFNVDRKNICAIVDGKTWTFVK